MPANSWDHLFNLAVDAPNETQLRKVPPGEYRARIEEVKLDTITFKKGDRKGATAPKVLVKYDIMDEALQAEWGREKITLMDNFILDLDAHDRIDTGPDRNIKLGQLREATGLNGPGFTLGQLAGTAPIMIQVKHRQDPDDPEKTYTEVGRVSRL